MYSGIYSIIIADISMENDLCHGNRHNKGRDTETDTITKAVESGYVHSWIFSGFLLDLSSHSQEILWMYTELEPAGRPDGLCPF